MLAGYLPFDDDPANPDGDNINLLYKYIVSTPLTFPEYVTPHARDLLRRILVPDPRKRADLFEVARHSWLSEYAHVVSHVTSNTTNISDITNTTVPPGGLSLLPFGIRVLTLHSEDQEIPQLARSASVREPPKHSPPNVTSVGALSQPGHVSPEEKARNQRDAKRRTVQVEYVAPQSQTARGAPVSGEPGRPTSFHRTSKVLDRETLQTKPLPSVPAGQEPVSHAGYSNIPYRNNNQGMQRPKSKDIARSISELTSAFAGTQGTYPQSTRPPTGGSMTSAAGRIDNRQQSRGSYSQPVAPAVATTNAQGRLAQPTGGRYNISAPMPLQTGHLPTSVSMGHPNQPSPVATTASQKSSGKGHKRSSTVSSIGEKLFGRSGSIFGGRTQNPSAPRPKADRRYPPTSMKEPYPTEEPRTSMDSRRSMSYFRKQADQSGRPRRFSFLPPSWSFKSSSPKEQAPQAETQGTQVDDFVRPQSKQDKDEPRLLTAPVAVGPNDSNDHHSISQGTQTHPTYQDEQNAAYPIDDTRNYSAQIDRQFEMLHNSQTRIQNELRGGYYNPTDKDYHQSAPDIQSSGGGYEGSDRRQARHANNNYPQNNTSNQSMPMGGGRPDKHNVLQKSNRKFADAYEYERSSHHSGSSGAARKVMDFFRRRGRARAGEDR